jgi:hypothetical protein
VPTPLTASLSKGGCGCRQLSYVKNEEFRTAAFSQPFSLLAELKGVNNEMVEVSGDTSNRLFEVLEEWELTYRVLIRNGKY